VWSNSEIIDPQNWSIFEIIKHFNTHNILEVGPGTHPKAPIKGTTFVDISEVSLQKLERLGGKVVKSDLQAKLPFENESFDLILCFEVLEHLPNDDFVLSELYRLLAPDGNILLSVPIDPTLYNAYDRLVGHVKRYELATLEKKIVNSGFVIVSYAFMNIPWPGKIVGKLMSLVVPLIYPAFSFVQRLTDSIPGSILRKSEALKPYKTSLQTIANTNTVLIQAKKIKN
jgi:SAM-dependent methyltransferase